MILSTLTLPDDLLWQDEHISQTVAQTLRRTLDGSPVIYYAPIDAGRDITLTSGEDCGWLTKTQIDALAVLAAGPGATYPLTLRGQTFTVLFRHHDAPAFEATPLWPLSNPQPGDFYRATLKLITV